MDPTGIPGGGKEFFDEEVKSYWSINQKVNRVEKWIRHYKFSFVDVAHVNAISKFFLDRFLTYMYVLMWWNQIHSEFEYWLNVLMIGVSETGNDVWYRKSFYQPIALSDLISIGREDLKLKWSLDLDRIYINNLSTYFLGTTYYVES